MSVNMQRREFIALLGSTSIAWPLAARAQQPSRARRIGVLMSLPGSDVEAPLRVAAFLQRLQELGWTDRRNVRIDYRLAESDTLQSVAAAQVALSPDIMLVNGSSGLRAARAATRTIPIVFVNVIDPVGQGFVMSLDHPGGNITGSTNIESEMGSKWLRLLKEIAPQVTEVAVVGADLGGSAGIVAAIRAAVPSHHVKLIALPVRLLLLPRLSMSSTNWHGHLTPAWWCCRAPSRWLIANRSLHSLFVPGCLRPTPIDTTPPMAA
jgi:putative tryptophan/tyrosine transport system substrate-binding protein